MQICKLISQFVWMMIFCSILLVSVAFIISSRIYKKMYPGMKLNSIEVVLIPFRYVWPNPKLRFQLWISIGLCNCTFYHKILLLAIMSFANSSCPFIAHSVFWLGITSSDRSKCPLISQNVLWLVMMSSDWS